MPMQGANTPMFVRSEDMKWERMFPEFGAGSPEMVVLRVDPKTQATQLMIKTPKGFHVPKHWHTANETHTVLSGRFIMECDGKRATYLPQVWETLPDTRQFLASLVGKAGLPADTRLARCKLWRYRVAKFL